MAACYTVSNETLNGKTLSSSDCEGHGTHVAAAVGGLSFGVAPGAKLHAVRILDCEGSGAGGGWGVALALVAGRELQSTAPA